MRAIGLLLIGLALAACAPSLDAEQMRLCRMLLPALYSEDAGIEILAAEAASSRAVHIVFRAGGEDGSQQLLTCRFGGTGYSAAKRDLSAVLIDGVGLGESTLHILKARWLEDRAALAADPGPPGATSYILRVSKPVALAAQHTLGALPRIAILMLLSFATALIYGLIGRIPLAFGEFAALGGGIAGIAALLCGLVIASFIGMIDALALGAALLTAALWGMVIGRSVLAPLAARSGQAFLVAGVGMMVAMQEGLRLAQGARTPWLPPVGSGGTVIAAAPDFTVLLAPRIMILALAGFVVIVFLIVFMQKSAFGRAWRAMADDRLAASLFGLSPLGILIATSLLATMLAGFSGALITLIYGGMPFSGGTMLGLMALIASILGGTGSLGGAVLGAAVIGILQGLWMAFFPIEHWELVCFALLTAMLIFRPGGFFGHAEPPSRRF